MGWCGGGGGPPRYGPDCGGGCGWYMGCAVTYGAPGYMRGGGYAPGIIPDGAGAAYIIYKPSASVSCPRNHQNCWLRGIDRAVERRTYRHWHRRGHIHGRTGSTTGMGPSTFGPRHRLPRITGTSIVSAARRAALSIDRRVAMVGGLAKKTRFGPAFVRLVFPRTGQPVQCTHRRC
jgi:hypothetical protein